MIAGLIALIVCLIANPVAGEYNEEETKAYGKCVVKTVSAPARISVDTTSFLELMMLSCEENINKFRIRCTIAKSKPLYLVEILLWTGEADKGLLREPIGLRQNDASLSHTLWFVGYKRSLFTELVITDPDKVELITTAIQFSDTINFRTKEQQATFEVGANTRRAFEEFQVGCDKIRAPLLF